MKLFSKKFSRSGRIHIYFCGIKIASYASYNRKVLREFRKTHKINLDDKNIVSLGYNCFPRTMLTKWGLKKSKSMGEPSYPFDLAVHPTKDLAKLLNNNFDGFLDNFVFHPSDGFWLKDGAKGFWINEKYNFLYVHDEDCDENNKEKLVERLANRKKNWDKMIKDKKDTYFFLWLDTISMKIDKDQTTKALKDMAKVIFKLRGNLPTKLIVWSMENIKTDIDNVYVIYAPFPWKGYVWYEEDRTTVKGTKFEHRIAQFCYDVLSEKKDTK